MSRAALDRFDDFLLHFTANAMQGGPARAEGPAKQRHVARWRGAAARYSSNDG
jgi:hypothetical protein